ncbi:MAG: dephospho-CoA kinase [Lachnotalea sp.]
MKIIGITGGVGAGKSSILHYIQEIYQARIVMADLVAHRIEEPGHKCYYQIVEVFGSSILNLDMTIDRPKLAQIVFQDEHKRIKLNQIVHPLVKEYIINEIKIERESNNKDFFIIEAALLIEDKYDVICDEIWYVYTTEERRRERLKNDRNYSDEKIDLIFKSQLPEAIFRKKSDIVIDNNLSKRDTYMQIDSALGEEH